MIGGNKVFLLEFNLIGFVQVLRIKAHANCQGNPNQSAATVPTLDKQIKSNQIESNQWGHVGKKNMLFPIPNPNLRFLFQTYHYI